MRTSRRLLREISIWKAASHPNVHSLCGLYERPKSLPAMVSPWCRNGDINRYLKTQQQNPHLDELKLRLLSQAIQGLDYLHDNHVVHADLKGGNVLISDEGVARLADFGLSALRTSDAFTSTSTVAGTYRWMAPELINENNARHTYASDIWAAGCLIIEVQSGSHPYYSAENDHYVLLAIGNREPPPRPPNMPDFLWSLVAECCEIEAENR
ncbi:kinase-like protein, partial [Exidia glandulosa HHB12029]